MLKELENNSKINEIIEFIDESDRSIIISDMLAEMLTKLGAEFNDSELTSLVDSNGKDLINLQDFISAYDELIKEQYINVLKSFKGAV